jgi:hypothetical protein
VLNEDEHIDSHSVAKMLHTNKESFNRKVFLTDKGNAARDLGSILIIVGGYCEIVGETISKFTK